MKYALLAESTMIRLGLCCIFRDQSIKFRTTTATAIMRLSRDEGREKLADLCVANAAALMEALRSEFRSEFRDSIHNR